MKYNFFKKKNDQNLTDNDEIKTDKEDGEVLNLEPIENNNGVISVINGDIIIKDPKNNGKKAKILPSEGVILKVNNERVLKQCEVVSSDIIDIEFEEATAKRKMNINVDPSKITATININYVPKEIFKLKDMVESQVLILEREEKERAFPPRFSYEEIVNALKEKGITYGLIEDNIKKTCSEESVVNLPVAQGRDVVNDTDDVIQYNFQVNKSNVLEEDSSGSIDYKSIGHVKPVVNGQVLCELISGSDGCDGVDVYGNILKKKTGKRLILSCGEHAAIEKNKIIALSDGKAYLNKGKVSVVRVHEVPSDVDIKSGNISFIGDIIIHGEVKDNMKVSAGHSIEIRKNVLDAIISGEGNIKINENVIHSKIIAGGNNVVKTNVVEDLKKLKSSLEELYNDIKNIREYNLMDKEMTDGQLVLLLLEKKYKNIPKMCSTLIKSHKFINGKLIITLKMRLLDIAPLNIKHYTEISEIISSLDENSKTLSYELDEPHNVEVNYSQDSQIQCTGSVYIHGKGQYISNIMANDSVVFTRSNSIARGGIIKATNLIKCGIVGSEVGVSTTLKVGGSGHIYAEVAYSNTVLMVGNRECTLEKSYKQVHAYLDSKGDLVVDKFVL